MQLRQTIESFRQEKEEGEEEEDDDVSAQRVYTQIPSASIKQTTVRMSIPIIEQLRSLPGKKGEERGRKKEKKKTNHTHPAFTFLLRTQCACVRMYALTILHI